LLFGNWIEGIEFVSGQFPSENLRPFPGRTFLPCLEQRGYQGWPAYALRRLHHSK
jgi:hypothetical protein